MSASSGNAITWRSTRSDDDVPVYPTIASQFNDPGITWMFVNLCRLLREKLDLPAGKLDAGCRYHGQGAKSHRSDSGSAHALPGGNCGAGPNDQQRISSARPEAASKAQNYYESLKALQDEHLPEPFARYVSFALREEAV